MTDSRTLGQNVPKEGLFLMEGIDGLRSLQMCIRDRFPRALTGFPVSSTAKVMYCRMLDAMLSNGQEDEDGILFVCFPVTAIATVLSRNSMTCLLYTSIPQQ